MKSYLLFFLCCVFFSASSFAQDDTKRTKKDRTLKNGFSVQLELGVPGSAHGINDFPLAPGLFPDFNPGFLIGLQLGNRWYVHREEQFGIGIMVNWFDFSVAVNTQSSEIVSGVEVVRSTLDMAFLEFGPVASYKLNNNSAIDAYYNLRPTVMVSIVIDEDENGFVSPDGGFTHALGFAYRKNAFYVGPEFTFGKIKNSEILDVDDADIKYGKTDLKAGSFRLLVGFKF